MKTHCERGFLCESPFAHGAGVYPAQAQVLDPLVNGELGLGGVDLVTLVAGMGLLLLLKFLLSPTWGYF